MILALRSIYEDRRVRGDIRRIAQMRGIKIDETLVNRLTTVVRSKCAGRAVIYDVSTGAHHGYDGEQPYIWARASYIEQPCGNEYHALAKAYVGVAA